MKPHLWYDNFMENQSRLTDHGWLADFIRPHCHIRRLGWKGKYPRVIQFPIEFASFLLLLREQKVKSYFEIGTSDGGALMCIDSYLRATVDGYDHAEGVDSRERDWSAYIGRFPKTKLHKCMSTKIDLKDQQFDAAMVDAKHFDPWILHDFNKVKDNARIIAFHDITLQGADVAKRWAEIKASHLTHWEFVDSTASEEVRCGIGVIDRRTYQP